MDFDGVFGALCDHFSAQEQMKSGKKTNAKMKL